MLSAVLDAVLQRACARSRLAPDTAAATHPRSANSSSSLDAEIQLGIACDVCAYGLGFPYLCWNAYFHSRLGRRYLNVTHVNEGKQITWRDFVMWTFKNINPVLCALLATLLLITAVLRLASSSNWLDVSHQSLTQVSLRALLLILSLF